MFTRYLALAACISSASAHIALFDKGMFGKNYPDQDGDSTVNWNTDDPVTPLKESDGRSMNDWFAHGRKAYPPKAGDFMVLPAGGSYSGEVACNRALTTLRNPTISTPMQTYACPENMYGDGIGALHTMNRYGSAADPKYFGGSALAIAYTSDVASLRPNDLTVISVNYNSVWERQINYQIPAGLPPCPSGGCLCTWNWIHTGGNGEGYPYEIYNNLYRCTVTGQTDSTKKVQRGAVPAECAGDASKCVKGPKTPMYIYQADGNNMAHVDIPPSYNARYGFSSGAQNDIFATATSPAPSTYMYNGWATPTGTNTFPAPTSTSLPSGWSAVGCNVDDPNNRALNGGSTSSSSMTIQSCVASCASRGFFYAGLQYGQECWCGNRLNVNLVASSECNVPCGGDSLAKCGGGYRLSVFASNQAPAIPTSASKVVAAPLPTGKIPSGWTDMGCIIDDPNSRALNRGSTSSKNLTVQSCIADCNTKGYIYAGVEYGEECWCGELANLRQATDGCNVPCGGDLTTICGGGYRLNVYRKGVAANSSTTSTSSSISRPAASISLSSSARPSVASSPSSTSSRSTTSSSSPTSTSTSRSVSSIISSVTSSSPSPKPVSSSSSSSSTLRSASTTSSSTSSAARPSSSTSSVPSSSRSVAAPLSSSSRPAASSASTTSSRISSSASISASASSSVSTSKSSSSSLRPSSLSTILLAPAVSSASSARSSTTSSSLSTARSSASSSQSTLSSTARVTSSTSSSALVSSKSSSSSITSSSVGASVSVRTTTVTVTATITQTKTVSTCGFLRRRSYPVRVLQ